MNTSARSIHIGRMKIVFVIFIFPFPAVRDFVSVLVTLIFKDLLALAALTGEIFGEGPLLTPVYKMSEMYGNCAFWRLLCARYSTSRFWLIAQLFYT